MEDPSGGGNVQVVEPGSTDDPFTAGNAPVVEPPADPPATPEPVTPSQPANDPDKPKPTGEGQDLLKLEEFIQGRVATAHSGLDKRINALTKQNSSLEDKLTESLKASQDAERRARAEGATDEEKAVLENLWSLEDRAKLLDARTEVVDKYRLHVTAFDLVSRFGKYGVTAETIGRQRHPKRWKCLQSGRRVSSSKAVVSPPRVLPGLRLRQTWVALLPRRRPTNWAPSKALKEWPRTSRTCLGSPAM